MVLTLSRRITNPKFADLNPKENEQKKSIKNAINSKDSLGGVVVVKASNIPKNLGEPIYHKLDGQIANAMMGINAVKAIEIGDSKKLVLTIKEYSSDIKYIEKLGLKGRYKFEEKYDFNISAKIFLNLFENLN